MDVFHCDLRINDRKIIVAEVPEALNTQPNQLVRKVHGALARHAQHGDHRLVRRTEAFQLGQRADGYAADLLALQGGVDIKRGNQLVAVGIAADKAGDRRAQAAGADQHGRQQLAVAKQQFANLGKQHIHLVADALLAKTAKTVKILPHLAGGGAHHAGQLAGRNFITPICLQVAQVAVIFGQPLDHGQRCFVLHC